MSVTPRFRALFFGTPAFAVPCLEALLEIADVRAVITQPDRPAGRGMKLTPPPVKSLALERGLSVLQPAKVRTADFAAELRAHEADVALVVAYGRILPKPVLDAPRLGCVNVHASLLPRWRGAAPIQWAIVHGDRETGVCLMQMDEGMDTGAVLACERTPIDPDETAGDLSARLSSLGAELVRRELPRYVDGELAARPQDHSAATHAPLMEKSHGHVDWAEPARGVHDLVRGTSPWPGAFTTRDGARLKIHRTHVVSEEGQRAEPGTIVRADAHGIEVACGRGILSLDELQLEGKRKMNARDLLAGHSFAPGARLGTRGTE